MKLKTSQMEIMGLAVIMVLLSLGLLFILKFTYKAQDDPNIRIEYLEKQLPSNILNALININLPRCHNQKVETLFRNCATLNNIKCNPIPGISGYSTACQYLNYTVNIILNKTLNKWHKTYYFYSDVRKGSDPFKIELGHKCRFYDAKKYLIAVGSDTISIELEVCRRE